MMIMFNSLRKFMFNSLHNLRKTSPSLIHANPLGECDWEAVKKHIKEKMENATRLVVPLKVDIGISNNWLDAH